MVATDAHRIVRSMVDQLAAGATTALSAVDPGRAAQEDLHGALYLSYAEMSDIGFVRGLERWQLRDDEPNPRRNRSTGVAGDA